MQQGLRSMLSASGVRPLIQISLLPLDVLHRATADRVGVTIGGAIVAVQSLLLVINLLPGARPGVGTIASVVSYSIVADVALSVLPPLRQDRPSCQAMICLSTLVIWL